MRLRLGALLLAASAAAFGADREFDRLVRAVESHFGVEQTHIPLMGFANFVLKVGHPAGASEFHLSVFEHLAMDGAGDGAALDRIMAEVSRGLDPLVRVRSNKSRECTYIYTAQDGKRTKMFIATFGRDEATVVELKLSMDALAERLRDPRLAGILPSAGRKSGADSRDTEP